MKKNKIKVKSKKKTKSTKKEKDIAQQEAGERQKFIDMIRRRGGDVREITDPYGR